MQFQIEVLSVVGPIKNQKGKNSWNVYEVAYKKDGKIDGKKVVDFNSPEVFKAVGEAKQGEIYTVTSEKNGEYWQWTGFTKDNGVAEAAPESASSPVEGSKGVAPAQRASSGSSSGRVTGSNYETPEERKIKQRFIVRQSSISNALEFFKMAGLKKENPQEVLELAEKFVEFVYKKPTAVEGLVEMSDDIPY